MPVTLTTRPMKLSARSDRRRFKRRRHCLCERAFARTSLVAVVVLATSACGGESAGHTLAGKSVPPKIDHAYAAQLESVSTAMNHRLSLFPSQKSQVAALRTIEGATEAAAVALRKLRPPAKVRVYNAALANSLAFLATAVAQLRHTVAAHAPGAEYQAILAFQQSKVVKRGLWALQRLRALGYPVNGFGFPAG
jgi:hypothetical protein